MKQQVLSLAVILLLNVAIISGQKGFRESDCDEPHTAPGNECKAYIIRYHWNNALQKCEQVVYGGCGATANNFLTKEDCENIARKVCAN